MYVLCVKNRDEDESSKAYVWKGMAFSEKPEVDADSFVTKAIEAHYGSAEDIEVIEELPADESDDFLNYFD